MFLNELAAHVGRYFKRLKLDQKIAAERFEFQMLYGIRRDLHGALQSNDGRLLLVLVPAVAFAVAFYLWEAGPARRNGFAFVDTQLFRLRSFLTGIANIGIEYVGEGRGNRIAAGLLIGWFASALGWSMERAVGGAGGVVVAHYAVDRGRQLEVAFRSVIKPHLAEGEVSAVRIGGASGGSTFHLSIQRDPERWESQ